MEKSTIIGLVVGMVSLTLGYVSKGANPAILLSPEAFFIILGGTASCLFTGFTFKQMRNFPKLIKKCFKLQQDTPKAKLLELFIGLAQIARREGILALENKVGEIDDPFFRSGLSMIIDGMDPQFVSDVLEAELQVMEQRHTELASIFIQAGTYAPTLGVMGAVIGLIAALGNLSDINKLGEAISSAFVATLMGIFTGYVLWFPIANKLKILSQMEIAEKRMIIEGILSLQAGDAPTAIEAKLMIFIPQSERDKIKTSGEKAGE